MRYPSLVLVLLLLNTAPALAGQVAAGSADQLSESGWTAMQERRFGDALEAFTAAGKLAPRDATIWLGAGNAAALLGQSAPARDFLERALALEPRLTAAALVLGQMLYAEGQIDDAIEVYERALKVTPDSHPLREALDSWHKEADTQNRFYQANGAHFSVRFEGPADDVLARRVVEMLEEAYYRIGAALSTYPTRTVTVILYTREQFRDTTRSPAWAGGLYDGRIKIPIRGALDHSEELQRVLAHELVHATVATLAGVSIPAWLNEGLATALEPGGLEWATARLAHDPLRVTYASLANGFGGLSAAEAAAAYAQSAVAVKRMIDLRGAPAVVSLIQALGRGLSFEAAFQQTIYMRYGDFAATLGQP